MQLNRRRLLKGAAGVALGLPVLESFDRNEAYAQSELVQPFAIFFRQANGVQQGTRNGTLGNEPERFWPTSTGALNPANVQGRTVGELSGHLSDLLVVRLNMHGYSYGDGHARGAMQGLTAAGPEVADRGGNSEAGGESIDHRIARQLNPNGRDPLFLYAGRSGGWLGGPCISYRGRGQRISALQNPWNAYQSFVSDGNTLPPQTQVELAARRRSVNDLVRDQMSALLANTRLSSSDRQRLELHQQNIRDLEVSLTCRLSEDQERILQSEAPGFDSTDGDEVLATARLHMQVATLAVACGQTRAVTIQVGSGNDGSTRYRNLDSGALMENFHFISHRRLSHGGDGAIIAGSDVLHHMVDVQFARTFNFLLDNLAAYQLPDGGNLLRAGTAIWYNDLGDGPPHSPLNTPFIVGGSAGGQLRQGQYLDFSEGGWNRSEHRRFLNTIGGVIGATENDGSPLSTFGGDGAPGGTLSDILV